jgi:hypothetical protein
MLSAISNKQYWFVFEGLECVVLKDIFSKAYSCTVVLKSKQVSYIDQSRPCLVSAAIFIRGWLAGVAFVHED